MGISGGWMLHSTEMRHTSLPLISAFKIADCQRLDLPGCMLMMSVFAGPNGHRFGKPMKQAF
jgi:hypothetical protein